MTRKTHRSKSHKRRHTRRRSSRHTRRNGGACPCSMPPQFGGRGGMGGAELGHAFTTGASQTLYQMTGQTPGLSSGGGKGSKTRARTRNAELARRAMKRSEELAKKANKLNEQANRLEERSEEAAQQASTFALRANAAPFYPTYMTTNNNGNNMMGNIIIPANANYVSKLSELSN